MTHSASRLSLSSVRDLLGIDLRTLALFRILLAVFLLADLLLRARDLSAHYSDAGIMPRWVQSDFLLSSSWSFHLANGSMVFQAVMFALAGFCAIGLLVGWRTRLMTVLSWLLLISLQNRNTYILSGEDNLGLLLLFWAMFLPLGARYSVDAALTRKPSWSSNLYCSLATAALLLQGMSMYFFSAILKTHPIWVPDGTAVYYALQLDYLVTPYSLWFRQFEGLMTGLTYYVYVLELIGPILIFSPLFQKAIRPLLMLAFMTMHLAFHFHLEIGLFPYISIVMNLTFLPSWIWDRLDRRLQRPAASELTIWYDGPCGFCEKSCHLLRTALFLRSARIRPAQEDGAIAAELEKRQSWVVSVGGSNQIKTGALAGLLAASPVFFPLAILLRPMAVQHLADRLYDLIGRNRMRLSRVTACLLPWRVPCSRYGPLTQAAAGVFLVFITVQNISTVPAAGLTLPDTFIKVRQALGLYQNWTMFAPFPEMTSPWPVIEGELTDGTIVDVYRGIPGPVSLEKPEVVSREYENYRWRKLLSQLEDQSYEDKPQVLALNYARYLCRQWSVRNPDMAPLSAFNISFQVERTPPPGGTKEPVLRSVWTHDCLG